MTDEVPQESRLLGLVNLARGLASQAAESVASLCDPENSRFWRNSSEMGAAIGGAVTEARFPTVSLASSIALLQGHQFLELPATPRLQGAVEVAGRIAAQYELSDLQSSSLAEGADSIPPFTAAQYLQWLSQYALIDLGAARTRLDLILAQLISHPSKPLDLEGKDGPSHPFLLYHLVRAARACERRFGARPELSRVLEIAPARLVSAAREIIASHVLGSASPDEYVALAFCGCGLAGSASGPENVLALSALRIAAQAQDAGGCWALGRIVEANKGADRSEHIEISTYEISWAMAAAARRLMQSTATGSAAVDLESIVGALEAAALFARRSVTVVNVQERRIEGWCSDHPYGSPLVESWTSATVLHAAIELQRLVQALQSERTLARFSHSKPSDEDWPRWLRWDRYVTEGEVDHDAPILRYLDVNLVQPILKSSSRLPSERDGTVSALLFGPPGTSKTTIVKGVADGLGWPLVQLNPGVFIERGLELIEAQARSVFEDLRRLRRAVVLFDECDELFRERSPAGATEQVRSITAFVTASMLPKLQDLHDLGRVVFVVCTNNFEALDGAVKRRGRIDHILGVGPPDEMARKQIVLSQLNLSSQPAEPAGVSRLYQQTERFTRGELTYLVRRFVGLRSNDSNDDDLSRRLISEMEPSLNISDQALAAFKIQAAKVSAPLLAKGV